MHAVYVKKHRQQIYTAQEICYMNNNSVKEKRPLPVDHWEVRPQVTIRQGTFLCIITLGLALFSWLNTLDYLSSYRNRTPTMQVAIVHVPVVTLLSKS